MAPLQIMRVCPWASPTTTERRRRSKSNGSSSTACQRSASSSALSPGATGVSSVPSARARSMMARSMRFFTPVEK